MAGIRIIRFVTKFLLISALLVSWLFIYHFSPVAAISVSDYFTIDYSISLSKSEIIDSETFSAVASGSAVCIHELPVTVTSASLTTCVVARNTATGAEIILNPGFSIKIEPFPAEVGETTQLTREVPLAFPEGSPSGTYSVIGELVQAKVLAIITIDVTDYLPRSSEVGIIYYDAAESQTDSPDITTGTANQTINTSTPVSTTAPNVISTVSSAAAAVEANKATLATITSISSESHTGTSSKNVNMESTLSYWWLAAVFLGAIAAGIGFGFLVRHILGHRKRF